MNRQDKEEKKMAFHYKDGWYFERIKDGGVRLYHLDGLGLMDRGVVIDADSWASIIASVSELGETASTFKEAVAFHAGDLPARAAIKEG